MSWDFLRITYPKAAKNYICAECRQMIKKGDRHAYTAGKVDAYFQDYRMCVACMDLAQAYCELINDEGWELGGLRGQCNEEGVGPDLAESYDAFIARAEASRADTRRRATNEALTRRAGDDVIAERKRQMAIEGYSRSDDDRLAEGKLVEYAARYLVGIWGRHNLDRRRRLVIAAALILAEIERGDRAELGSGRAK